MALDRNALLDAVAARLSGLRDGGGASVFATVSRRLQTVDNISRGKYPAIFVQAGPEQGQTRKGYPTLWLCSVELYLCNSETAPTGPGPALMDLIGLVEATFEQDPTLGGLVTFAAIHSILPDEGPLLTTGVARLDLVLTVAASL